MRRLGVRYVSLTRSPVDSLEEEIRIKKPHVLLGNVESLSVQDIQRQICKMQISYIAVDEAQVKPFWPNSYSVSQIGGRSFEGVG